MLVSVSRCHNDGPDCWRSLKVEQMDNGAYGARRLKGDAHGKRVFEEPLARTSRSLSNLTIRVEAETRTRHFGTPHVRLHGPKN